MSARRPLVLAALVLVACKGGKESSGPAPTPTPTVQSITVSPATATLASIGATATLAAEVRLSDGSVGTQSVSWTSSAPNVASVAGGVVTAVANGQATITAAIGNVSGTATMTVAQAVASMRLLPADTVIKGAATLRASALDARGNPIAGQAVQWQALTPAITTVNESGTLTPASTGVARIRVTAGSATATAIVRTVWNVQKLSDLFPLFEYSATAGQRRAVSDVSQTHADTRATVIAGTWSYLEGILPTSGSPTTAIYFTTWPQIWTEFTPFCGGQLLQGQTAWTACNTPNAQHFLIPETADDFYNITRFLSRQFILASHTDSRVYPWFVEGLSQWLAGGSLQGGSVNGKAAPVHLADFKSGDTQSLLSPLDTLVRLPSAKYYENLPQRTPVAVRMAQGALFVQYLNLTYPGLLTALYTRLRNQTGNPLTNDGLIQELVTRTGKTIPQLEAAYVAYARAL